MKKILLGFLTAMFAILPSIAQSNKNTDGNIYLNERIIVKFKGNLDSDVEDDIFVEHKVKKHKYMKELRAYVVLAKSKDETLDIVSKLKKRKDVEFAEPDMYCEPVGKFEVPNDPDINNQYWINKINLPDAWDLNKGSANIVIAILDSGCDPTHPDLIDKYVPGYNFYDNNTITTDVYGHGTAVAGCAGAATNNGIGMASAGRDCKLMPIRISDSTGYAYWSTLAQGLQWAADRGAKVANASFRAGESTTVQSAARYMNSKGGVFVCSAGNQSTQLTGANTLEVICVGATDSADNLASFSNWGTSVDVVAPGVATWTTSRGGGYGFWSGTSFSSPITAGVCGLMFSLNPAITPTDVDKILKSTSVDLGDPGPDLKFASGRINAQAALQMVSSLNPTPPTPIPGPDITAPIVNIVSPINGSAMSRGTIQVTSTSFDNIGVVRVELYVDGKYITNSSIPPFTVNWNARKALLGAHQILLRAKDAAGNTGTSQTITIFLN